MTTKKRKFKSGADYFTPSRYVIHFAPDTDKAVQSGKESADINVLVRRFGVTGNLPRPSMQPFYGDFSEVEDYRTAVDRVLAADRAFLQLPSDVRNRFNNDPAQLMEFLHSERTPEMVEEGRRLGLIEPEEAIPAPMRVEVVNPPTPPAESPPAGS